MVQRLLKYTGMKVFLLGTFFFSACLVLEPIIEPNPDGTEQNLAPSVDPTKVVPGFDTFPSVLMVQPEIITFDLGFIEDPNLTDTLFVRFYADGKNTVIIEKEILPNDQLKRPVTGEVLGEEALNAFRNQNGLLEGRHRLEVIIADDEFVAESGEGARQIQGEGKSAYYYWELEF